MYTFSVTAKRTITNAIPKGASVTIVKKQSTNPTPKEILAAYKQQLGITVEGVEISVGYFNIVKL